MNNSFQLPYKYLLILEYIITLRKIYNFQFIFLGKHIRAFINIHINLILISIYLLTAIGLTPSGSSTVNIYTQTIHRTTQLTTFVGRLSGIRTQSGQTSINDELTT